MRLAAVFIYLYQVGLSICFPAKILDVYGLLFRIHWEYHVIYMDGIVELLKPAQPQGVSGKRLQTYT